MGQSQSNPVCTTPACVHAAAQILKNLAPHWQQMDPCTEFDKMVCYGFTEHVGDDQTGMSVIELRNRRMLRRILESASHREASAFRSTLTARDESTEDYVFDLLRTSYQACMDTDAIGEAGIRPLTDLIVSLNTTWPVSPDDLAGGVDASEYEGLAEAALFVERLGVGVFRAVTEERDGTVLPDPFNSKVNRFYIELPGLGQTNTSLYLDPPAMESYVQAMAEMFHLAYPELDENQAAALAAAVADLESDIAQVIAPFAAIKESPEAAENPYAAVKNVSVAELAAAAPALGLDKLVEGLSPAGKAPTQVLLEHPPFWGNFSHVVSSHPPAAVQGFLASKTIRAFASYVDSPALLKALGQEDTEITSSTRWETCVQAAGTQLRHVLDYYYVSATYPELARETADRMTTRIRNQFKKRIDELAWMSEAAKERAAAKVDNMVQNIGYPTSNPDLRSMESLAAYYEGLNVTAGDFFGNMVAARRHATAKGYAAVARPADRTEFVGGSVSTVNAFYNPTVNSMTILAGISQLPVFHHGLPGYALYGGLGSVIGHELTHGFDSNGYKYNEDAEFRAWWDNSTVTQFTERTRCFVDQYAKYEVDVGDGRRKNVDGELTLGENLSDAGGLRVAFEAWLEDRKEMPNARDQSLPGLENFTHEQLFFIFNANIWCDSHTAAVRASLLQSDNHAPNRYRILGGAANSRAFREAFNCPVKEPECELFR